MSLLCGWTPLNRMKLYERKKGQSKTKHVMTGSVHYTKQNLFPHFIRLLGRNHLAYS